ncbi:adenylosuccinate lyase [Sandaracinomonas limnophila]|uniref:Adenylosuccinate lyase n=1 Tax=Sandaracinomonas limnophila TaxID=1862386 RepID=A0A437PUJ4_9BACT|nr:adenylosuccinate lyase [Sandaracinomonas limnophila]RVU25925.1 adenylosuccinate lyase [Sandaracinomonas limnophila]
MDLSLLSAISPVDGRYRKQTEALAPYFSEFGLIQFRIRVEIEYFIALCNIPLEPLKGFPQAAFPELRKLYIEFTEKDAQWIKDKEKVTNHDVKAVEYFIKERMLNLKEFGDLSTFVEFIHFGLTSQDINNSAIPLSMKEAQEAVLFPGIVEVKKLIADAAEAWKDVALLAHTHGQPASPTRLGKEFKVFVERLDRQIDLLEQVPFSGKFGGATGNFNAHTVAFPAINWPDFAHQLLQDLGINRSKVTTQIEHYDNMAAYFDALKRINTILIDLSRDIWTYISMGYFKQKIKAGEIGSSAMPHKVNPIDFENAEGNLATANALFEFLSSKLPVSRLQRDLTDSTVLRNVGVPLAHTLIAINSLKKGLGKLELNPSAIEQDLQDNYVVIAEAIQTVLRREAYPQPYEALKDLTRNNQKIDKAVFDRFIDDLGVSEAIKTELKQITPFNYVGVRE